VSPGGCSGGAACRARAGPQTTLVPMARPRPAANPRPLSLQPVHDRRRHVTDTVPVAPSRLNRAGAAGAGCTAARPPGPTMRPGRRFVTTEHCHAALGIIGPHVAWPPASESTDPDSVLGTAAGPGPPRPAGGPAAAESAAPCRRVRSRTILGSRCPVSRWQDRRLNLNFNGNVASGTCRRPAGAQPGRRAGPAA
jgi:hypothetical protein